jgi:hypothetical protein
MNKLEVIPSRALTLEEAITRRANDIWTAEGRPEGEHLRHWLEAEAQILQERNPTTPEAA